MSIDIEQQRDVRKTILGFRASAIVEMLIAYAVLMLVNIFFMGTDFYMDIAPHPFWFVVVVIAAQYGTKEGLLAAIIACLIYFLAPWPEQQFGEDRFAYIFERILLPILWLVMAVIVGEIRARHRRERTMLEDELEESQKREEVIAESYAQVREIKSALELRTATQIRSTIGAHKALKSMEILNESQVLQGMEQLALSTAQLDKFSVYLADGNGFSLRQSYGWVDGDVFEQSFQKQDALVRELMEKQHAISVLNEESQQILAGHGMLVIPMKDSVTGNFFGFIKVEQLPFTSLNFNTIETLQAVAEMGAMNLVNLEKYRSVQSNSMTNPEYGVHSNSYFYRYTEFISALGKRQGFDVSMLVVKLADNQDLPYETQIKAIKLFTETVESTLRKVDMTFDYQQQSEAFSIVLPGTDKAGAEIVRQKIQTQLGKTLRRVDASIRFSFTIEQLHAV